MYSITPPDSRFVENKADPVQFSQGTIHLRHLLKWALAELDYQSQRGAIALIFDNPVAYLQFLTEQLNPRLLALHNILPSLSNFPSGNTEDDVYLRNKLRRSFEDLFGDFLAANQRLFVSELPMFTINIPNRSDLLKRVAIDFISLWKDIFEQVLRLTDDVQQAKAHANADGNVTLKLKIDAPESYQQLIHWLTEQAQQQDAKPRPSMAAKKPLSPPEQDVPVIGDFAARVVGVSVILLGLGVFIHFLPMSLWAALLLGIVWFFTKTQLLYWVLYWAFRWVLKLDKYTRINIG